MLRSGGRDERPRADRARVSPHFEVIGAFYDRLDLSRPYLGTEEFGLGSHGFGEVVARARFEVARIVFQMVDEKSLAAGGGLLEHERFKVRARSILGRRHARGASAHDDEIVVPIHMRTPA
jgi:hypothetical protein